MADLASVKVVVHGRVQGVGFRYFALKQGSALGLTGYVRNREDKTEVECVAEGERASLKTLVSRLNEGPRLARVESIDTDWSDYSGNYTTFEGRR